MYGNLFRSVILPLGEAIQQTTILRSLRFLNESQWWSPEELAAWQEERLQILIHHAYQKVPYYRELFIHNGLVPDDIRTVQDLRKLPVTTKDDIRRNYSRFMAEDMDQRRVMWRSTGGTSGEPLQYPQDVTAWSMDNACTWRGWQYAGYRLGDKLATLASSSLIPNEDPPLIKRLFWSLQRNLPLSAVHMSDEIMAAYVAALERFQPQFLRGYPTAWFLFADYLGREGTRSIRPHAVLTTSEVCLPAHRALIEDVFECEVFDGYGCGDGGGNAMECSAHGGHHFSMERAILEIVRNGEPVTGSESGEFLLTDLHNFAMPFIRYRVGDAGGWADAPCTCGRGLPVLSRLDGRLTDIVVFEGGVSLAGVSVAMMFKDTGFMQYQLVQTSESSVLARAIRGYQGTTADTRDRQHVLKALRSHLGERIQIDWQFVDSIPVPLSGKHQLLVSEVADRTLQLETRKAIQRHAATIEPSSN